MLIRLITLCCSRQSIQQIATYVRQQVSSGINSDVSMGIYLDIYRYGMTRPPNQLTPVFELLPSLMTTKTNRP